MWLANIFLESTIIGITIMEVNRQQQKNRLVCLSEEKNILQQATDQCFSFCSQKHIVTICLFCFVGHHRKHIIYL